MFKQYNQNQLQLLPPDLSDMIAKDHLARLINHVVDEMDLFFIEQTYSSNGQHAYPPRMLLKILVYGYASGVRSSRKLADRLKEDIVCMWLAGRLTPDFRTIADFRKDKLADFKKIFEEVLETSFQIGMARVGKVMIDGTKIRASASKNKAVYRVNLARRKELIKKKVGEIIAEAEKLDEEEEKLYGNATPHRTGKIFTKEDVAKALKKVRQERNRLAKKKAVLKIKANIIKEKEIIMRKDRNSFTSSDPDATVMMMKEGYIAPGYNVQLATEHQVILGYDISSDRNDTKLLKPMVREVQERTNRKPETIGSDSGYGTKKNYRYLKKERIASYIPYPAYEQERILRNKGLYEPPKNPDHELEKYKFRQRLRLQSEEGKLMMKQRREDVEPTIGNLKRNLGFRRFNLRGKQKCELELGLFSVAHNLIKIKNWVRKLAKWDDGRRKGIELGIVLGYRTA